MLPDTIDTSKLTGWHKSKRKGFFDVYGELKINYADNTCLILKSFKNKFNYHCLINENKKIWKLIERDKLFYANDGTKVEGNVEYQSELSGKIIKKILLSQKCELPELSWSIECHKLLIKSLLNHWNSYYNTRDKVLAIT